ncbi:MAG TPA: hypothetical protein VI382_02905, partial [Candidatus Manganitrophaceae bacterium]|nr:hypothetical protein [Candidatus Manganitrophaceae bacterium]
MGQKKGLLIGLLVFWGLVFFYRMVFFEGPRTAPLKYTKGASAKREGGDGLTQVRMDLLEQDLPSSPGDAKNIFTPLSFSKPPPPPPPVL